MTSPMTCKKLKHKSQAKAREHMRFFLSSKFASRDAKGKPNTYRCPLCGWWHWGHTQKVSA